MFVQIITATVVDAEGLERQVDQWDTEIRPGAEGFLGSTSGVTDDGHLLVLVRFESEEAAQRNSTRPEQEAWWTETAKTLQRSAAIAPHSHPFSGGFGLELGIRIGRAYLEKHTCS